MKSGTIAVELLVGNSKKRPMTTAESQVAVRLETVIAMIITDFASMIPGSSFAVGEDDIETLKGIENLNFKKGENEK
jgi:hypothetical protein